MSKLEVEADIVEQEPASGVADEFNSYIVKTESVKVEPEDQCEHQLAEQHQLSANVIQKQQPDEHQLTLREGVHQELGVVMPKAAESVS